MDLAEYVTDWLKANELDYFMAEDIANDFLDQNEYEGTEEQLVHAIEYLLA